MSARFFYDYLENYLSSFFVLLSAFSVFAAAPDSFDEEDELLLFQDMDVVVSISRKKQSQNLFSALVSMLSACGSPLPKSPEKPEL